MNVLLDNIIFYLQRSGGGSVYWIELVKRLVQAKDVSVTIIEPQGPVTNLFYDKAMFPAVRRCYEVIPKSILTFLSVGKAANSKFIFHSSYYRLARSKHAVNILTIHDFTPELYFKGLRRFVHVTRKARAITKADAIVCISENTKSDLLRLYPAIDPQNITVIYNGVSDDYFPIDKSELNVGNFRFLDETNDKFILYVGHRTNYKNFNFAVDVMAKLPSYRFLIVGEALNPSELLQIDSKIKGRYKCLSGINNAELNILYNVAHCLLYPSSYEGFGIPVVEAMKAGCPVIALNRSSIPEVIGDLTLLVDELNTEKFVEKILQYEDKGIRQQVVTMGLKNSLRFSWDLCSEKLLAFYKKHYDRAN